MIRYYSGMFDGLYVSADIAPRGLRNVLARNGCLVLREALDPEPLHRLHEAALAFFGGDDALGLSDEQFATAKRRGVCPGAVLTGDPLAFARMLRPLAQHLRAFLGETPALSQGAHVRYRNPADPATALPFHQHRADVAQPGRNRFLGIIIPFADFDGTRPDVEFVAQAIDRVLPKTDKPTTQFAEYEVAESVAKRDYAPHLWRPRMKVGDVCVFREGTLHRSYVGPDMTATRTSVDLRLCGAETPIFPKWAAVLLPSLRVRQLPHRPVWRRLYARS